MSSEDRIAEVKRQSFTDRRVYQRCERCIGVKLRRQANASYSIGHTLDLSMGGAALELVGPREAQPGERIAIAFEHLNCPVTRAARMIGAQIVRAQPLRHGRQRIAVRFDAPQCGLEVLDVPAAA